MFCDAGSIMIFTVRVGLRTVRTAMRDVWARRAARDMFLFVGVIVEIQHKTNEEDVSRIPGSGDYI